MKEKSRKVEIFKENFQDSINSLPYIEKDTESFKAKLIAIPERGDIPIVIDDYLIIEYYSK